MIRRAAFFWVVVFAVPLLADDSADKKKLELDWAKGVATDFLKAVRATEAPQARQLLVPELRKQYPGAIEFPFPLGSGGTIDGWQFAKEQMAPDRDEVVIEGKATGKNAEKEYESSFSLRVVKCKDSGRWRIDYFLIEQCVAKSKK